jgi:hypothetical protein
LSDEVEPRFKPERPAPKPRAWNSTLPQASRVAKPVNKPKAAGRTLKSGKRARTTAEDRAFKTGSRSTVCVRCGQHLAVDASHYAPRSQRPDLRGDPHNRDDLCRECHRFVEAHPEAAKAEGWRSAETYEKANAEPIAKLLRKLR